jgi:hypothetical protein
MYSDQLIKPWLDAELESFPALAPFEANRRPIEPAEDSFGRLVAFARLDPAAVG